MLLECFWEYTLFWGPENHKLQPEDGFHDPGDDGKSLSPPSVHSHPPALPAGPMETSMSLLACGASQHPAVAVHCLHTVSKKDVTGEEGVSILKWDRKQGRGRLLPSESKWCDQYSRMSRWVSRSLVHHDVLSWKSATAW